MPGPEQVSTLEYYGYDNQHQGVEQNKYKWCWLDDQLMMHCPIQPDGTVKHTNVLAGGIELRAAVHYPLKLTTSKEKFPFILLFHGRHQTCEADGSDSFDWPCKGPEILSYRGFDYIARHLASYGFIVVSISANGMNAAPKILDWAIRSRGELVKEHIEVWQYINETGRTLVPWQIKFEHGLEKSASRKPVDLSVFQNKIDLQNVGTLGHSMGGEGVVEYYYHNFSENPGPSSSHKVKVNTLFLVAPENYRNRVINSVPLGLMLSYCDGDRKYFYNLLYYNLPRYNNMKDLSPKHMFLLMGANHNFYNTKWTIGIWSSDDWETGVTGGYYDDHCSYAGERRLRPAEQRETGLQYISAFFRRYLQHDKNKKQLDAFLIGEKKADVPTHVSYHPGANDRLDINLFLEEKNLYISTLGDAVTYSRKTLNTEWCRRKGQFAPCDEIDSKPAVPYKTCRTFRKLKLGENSAYGGVRQLRLTWRHNGDQKSTGDAWYQNEIPKPKGDVSHFNALQFRVAVDPCDPLNQIGEAQDFQVVLTYSNGQKASIRVGSKSDALYYPPGSHGGANYPVPKVLLNTVRLRLDDFKKSSKESSNLEYKEIQSIRFEFSERKSGAIYITDLAVVK